MTPAFERALQEIDGVLAATSSRVDKLRAVARVLQKLPRYTGVYFYTLQDDTLELEAFHGRPTAHTHIPVGTGICGTSAKTGECVVVEDVRADDRYLACNTETQSEIVMPIKRGEQYLAQIDVDSDTLGAFGLEDRAFLAKVAQHLERIF